ncbi:hypothetical protein F4805DRAFT_475668 [Annulohypoxylon moriforme]|nr:hypothetical protein F4805DRAFT_475668 [Annulohypoxylon moriforme]
MSERTPLLEPQIERPAERPASKSDRSCQSVLGLIAILITSISGYLCLYNLFIELDPCHHGGPHNGTDEGNATSLIRRTIPSEPTPIVTISAPTPTPSGDPLFDLPRRHLGDVPYGVPIFECNNPGEIALTFNEGPSEYTQLILDELDRYDFKATFFMTGVNTSSSANARHTHIDDPQTGWPDLLSRIHESGHQFASHTYTHARLDGISANEVVNEMVYNEMAFRNAINLIPMYMRPPYGVWRDPAVREQLDGLGYHVILHNIDTLDYENDSEEGIQKSIDIFNDEVRWDGNGKYIVQMQDVRKWTALKLVPAILKTMSERGYKGVTVGECLEDAFFYWYRQPEPKEPGGKETN